MFRRWKIIRSRTVHSDLDTAVACSEEGSGRRHATPIRVHIMDIVDRSSK